VSLLDDMAVDLAGLFEVGQLGEVALYRHASDGAQQEVLAIVERGIEQADVTMGSATLARVYVQPSDIALPAIYDEITVDGTVYVVRQAVRSGPLWSLDVEDSRRVGAEV
jgi:hypothetical protein